MKHALVSGRAGIAIFMADEGLRQLDVDHIEGETSLDHRAIHDVFAIDGDFRAVEYRDTSSLRALLMQAWLEEEALQLALILLDDGHSERVRRIAAAELERTLESTALYVERVLVALPLPKDSNIGAALQLSRGCRRTEVLLERVLMQQDVVNDVYETFQHIASSFFVSDTNRAWAQTVFIRAGVYRALAAARVIGTSAEEARVALLAQMEVSIVPGGKGIIEEWLRLLTERDAVNVSVSAGVLVGGEQTRATRSAPVDEVRIVVREDRSPQQISKEALEQLHREVMQDDGACLDSDSVSFEHLTGPGVVRAYLPTLPGH